MKYVDLMEAWLMTKVNYSTRISLTNANLLLSYPLKILSRMEKVLKKKSAQPVI